MKAYQLAKLIHISQGSLSDIENNKSLPSADTIAKLYQHTNLNIIWLLLGKGPMIKGELANEELSGSLAYEELAAYGEDPVLNDLIEKLVRVYRKGDVKKRAHIVGYLNGADPGE